MTTVASDPGARGHIVTFYSYKGGTGRTMAMANVAWLLASNGARVLTIDWDLESPGLHRYFHPFLRDRELRNSDGILDLVRRYAEATGKADASRASLDGFAQIRECAASLDWDFPLGGLIDFVPAGRQDDGYATKVSTFDWDSFWSRRGGGQFIHALREDMARHYDYVLIDSRTGTSDTAGICTIELPDTVVNCFTLNKQSIDGAVAITNSILHRSKDRVSVYPVPTRIEDGEKDKLDRGRNYSRRRFAPLLKFLDRAGDANAYWDSVEVPYIPYYAYEELLAAFGDRPGLENSLLARYQRLARRITGRDCPSPQIPETERVRIRRIFEQSTPAEPTDVVIAYAPLDRVWAEWLRERLTGPAYHVTLQSVRSPLTSLAGVERLIIVHSRDYAAHDEGVRLLRLATERMAVGDTHFLVAVRVDATPVGELVPSRALVDVMGVEEGPALDLLATSLALDPVDAPKKPGDAPVTIRYPAMRAPHWNVQLVRNSRFSGRGGLLEQIRDQLLSAGTEGGRLALTGLPGVGKTQAALEYVYRFAASYSIVWWVSASQPTRARVVLANLLGELGLPRREGVEAEVAAVLDELRQNGSRLRYLLVFDNVDAPGDVSDLIPSGAGHVLITSRNPQWADRMLHLDVGVFQRNESVELFGRRVPGIPRADAAQLAERLGDLPLAIEQAGGWLNGTAMTVADYLRLFDRSATDVADAMDENAPEGYTETVTKTVQVAYDELRQRNPAAAHLLELFAFMAPEPIPFRLISNRRLTSALTAFDPMMSDAMRHGTLNREIGRYGLARVDSGTGGVVIHRLTQDIVRARLTSEEQADRRRELWTILAAADLGSSPNDRVNWPQYESLRPHLQSSGIFDADAPEVRQLLIDMARYLWERGDVTGCEELVNATLKEWQPRFGPDDPWTLRMRYQLGVAVRNQGREVEAYEINKENLERLQRALGKDDPYALSGATTLGADLRAKGEYHDARELDEQTVAGYRQVLGDNNPETLNAVNNLGVSLRLVGDFAAAAERDRDTLERRRRVLGNTNSATLKSAENYGVDLRELGDLEGSRNHLDAAYASLHDTLGDDHDRTIRCGASFAMTLRRLGSLKEAGTVLDRVVGSAESVLGSYHPVTMVGRLERACLLWASNRPDEARDLADNVYAAYLQGHDEHHPVALAIAANLSIFRRAAGDVEGSRRLAEKTAERLETPLGPLHPHTLAATVAVANALYADGARAAARQKDETAYTRLRKKFDDDHPSVLAAAVNYSVSHRADGQEQADRLRADAIERLHTRLGDHHAYTIAAREGHRIDLDIQLFFT